MSMLRIAAGLLLPALVVGYMVALLILMDEDYEYLRIGAAVMIALATVSAILALVLRRAPPCLAPAAAGPTLSDGSRSPSPVRPPVPSPAPEARKSPYPSGGMLP